MGLLYRRARARRALTITAAAVIAATATAAVSQTASAKPSRRKPVPASSSSPSPSPSPTPSADVLFSEDFSGLPASWSQGSTVGDWRLVFDGYGSAGAEIDGTDVHTQSPQASTSPGETHATLVTSVPIFGDLDMTVRARTVSQLRTPAPNAWETAWVLWHYSDNTHFYYVILKPNGWELGKEDPAYPGAQRFLATGEGSFPVGAWYTIRIRQVADTITVWAGDAQLVSFTDAERPYSSGSIGLYNEDAHTHFDDVVVRVP